MDVSANSEAIEAWNTVLFEKFCRFRHLVTTGLSNHGDALLERHPPRAGAKVLDVGCGFGDTTLRVAELVGGGGEAVGVDAAANFIEGAENDRRAEAVDNARFFVADVQSDDLGGPYDEAISRFGTMFFASPVAAFRNVRRALAPGGRLSIVVWRRREDNPWLHVAETTVRGLVEEPESSDQVTCGPGPFSMASADAVSDILHGAGFEKVRFERFEADICIGHHLDEAVELALALGPAGEILRLAGEAAQEKEPEVRDALRQALGSFERDGAVYAPSSTWIIDARVPR